MIETEARLAATEMLLIEVLADLDPAALQLAKERIMGQVADLETGPRVSEEEKTVRLAAVRILEDAQRRFVLFNRSIG